jgi:hypothetical protein
MSYYAVEWRVFAPLTRITIGRVVLRTIDGVDFYVALRDVDGEERVLGSWNALPLATESVLAMYQDATGEDVYGEPGVGNRLRVHPQTPLPGAAMGETRRDDPRQAAMPSHHASRR